MLVNVLETGVVSKVHHHAPPAETQTQVTAQTSSHGQLPLAQGDKHKRVALSLHVARLAGGGGLEALQPGALVPAAVKAVEDHGYSLSFGIKVGCAGSLGRMTCSSTQQVGGHCYSLSFGSKVGSIVIPEQMGC